MRATRPLAAWCLSCAWVIDAYFLVWPQPLKQLVEHKVATCKAGTGLRGSSLDTNHCHLGLRRLVPIWDLQHSCVAPILTMLPRGQSWKQLWEHVFVSQESAMHTAPLLVSPSFPQSMIHSA